MVYLKEHIGKGRMPPKKKPAALSAKQEEEELSEMVRKHFITKSKNI